MRYALLDGKRVEAEKAIADATCECCSDKVYPACGDVNVHHFRHFRGNDCDSWYEPITQWHLNWQNRFPEQFREVVINRDGKKHRADILNARDVVLEFQNSPISLSQVREREQFYGKMVWVFNGDTLARGMFTMEDKKCYTWQNPNKTILSCERPVFIDRGNDLLYWLFEYKQMPKFRMRYPGAWEYVPDAVDAVGEIDLGICSRSYYAIYPIRIITKKKFIEHYK